MLADLSPDQALDFFQKLAWVLLGIYAIMFTFLSRQSRAHYREQIAEERLYRAQDAVKFQERIDAADAHVTKVRDALDGIRVELVEAIQGRFRAETELMKANEKLNALLESRRHD